MADNEQLVSSPMSYELGRLTGRLDALHEVVGKLELATLATNEKLEGLVRRLDQQNGTVASLVAWRNEMIAKWQAEAEAKQAAETQSKNMIRTSVFTFVANVVLFGVHLLASLLGWKL